MRELSHTLPPHSVRSLIRQWLAEDTPSFDCGGFVVGDKEDEAWLLCKSRGVLSGCPFFQAVFDELDCSVQWHQREGDLLEPTNGLPCRAATIRGKARNLLLGERVALNTVCRSSGISSVARHLRELADKAGWKGEIAGTRKTTPGFRLVEKYALLVGGVSTHRYDLSSMIMLKDNHIWSVGGIKSAIERARQVGGFSLKIEVECRSLDEAIEACQCGADVVMLDNFKPLDLHETAKQVKECFPHVIMEASGGIQPDNIQEYFSSHIDVISMGSLTQGYPVVDFSMKIQK